MNKKTQKKPKKRKTTVARQVAFIEAYVNNRFNISAACRSTKISRAVFYKWQRSERFQTMLDDAVQQRIDEVEAALFRNIQSGDSTCIIFFLKTWGRSRGFIETAPVKAKDTVSSRATEILGGVLAGSIKPEDAGIMFDQIGQSVPEGLRLLIQKVQPEPEDPCAGWNQEEMEKELDAKYAQRMKEVEEQKAKWLPNRQAEIAELKQELKEADSWTSVPKKDKNEKEEG